MISASSASVDLVDESKSIIESGDWVYESIDSDTHWEIDEYVGEGGNVVVPRFFNNKMVVTIGSYSFVNNNTVTAVTANSPIWTIGEYAFLNCSSLESFACNFALKEIGDGAFLGTSSLRHIDLETSAVTVIRPHVFSNSGISEIQLPESCSEIMHDAFAQCPDLVKLVIPRSVTVIGDDAFARSDNLVIYCYTDSAAHQYAVANNIPFVLLDAVPEGYLLGDTDNNDDVEVIDATWLQRYVALMDIGVIEDTVMQGDVDGDGDASVVDATFIMRYCVGISTPYDIGEIVTDN